MNGTTALRRTTGFVSPMTLFTATARAADTPELNQADR